MITVCLCTYNRLAYAQATLRSISDNLQVTGDLNLHIADDGSPPGYVEALLSEAGRFKRVTVSDAQRGGYGRNVNLATQTLHKFDDVILMLEDDWVLIRPTSFDDLIAAARATDGTIRLGYIGFTDTLRGVLEFHAGQLLLEFDAYSPEKHVFAGHPRLETVSRQREMGPWPEGLNPGHTELTICGRKAVRHNVFWPMSVNPHSGYGLFAHIGTEQSY